MTNRLARLLHSGLRLLLALWLSSMGCSSALAQDHITQRAWLEDPRGELTWPVVQFSTPTSYSGTLSKGFGSSVIWLRLHIDPHAYPAPLQAPDRLVLRIRPVYLDEIRVYDPLLPHALAGIVGDAYHPRLDEFQGLDFLVPIERGAQPRDIWLRLTSTSTRQIDVQALNLDDLNRRAHTQSLAFAGYVGLVAVLAVWGLVYWLFSREILIGAFAVMQMTALLFALSSLGHLRAMWPLEWPARLLHEATTVFSITAVSAAVWFHTLLLKELSPPVWVRRIHLAMIALLPLKLLVLALGWTTSALRLNMMEVLLVPAIFLASVLLAEGWDKPAGQRPAISRNVMISFYIMLLSMLMGAALPALGLISSSEIGLYIVQLHGLVTAFLVLLMLQYRGHVLSLQQRDTAFALERSILQTRQERTIREEQEKLLAMLGHELKTPLATMHMRLDNSASGSTEIMRAIRDMNNVIDRCQQTLQLSDCQLVPRFAAADMVSMVSNAVSACAQPERIQKDLPEHLPIQADPQLCFIVLNNLLENACKYAAPGTPIAVRLTTIADQRHPPGIQLEISNQPGQAGWPDPDRVFDKYYRSPHARRQAGTGLGLYLVQSLVQVMGGRIEYAPSESAVRFVLYLPLQPVAADLA